ncbi:MAG: hypothetical protein II738_05050, partial [Clostridia bacterium]|nr:hypothetical protein [Clostridia bacterium]
MSATDFGKRSRRFAARRFRAVEHFSPAVAGFRRFFWYSNMICGVIRGALEAINIKVECKYNQDTLKGSEKNE